MYETCSGKSGFTLVEVLVVVIIMGVLSSLGVVGFQNAVANSRIKDAGINVTAFMERAANEATRLNEKLCMVASGKSVYLYKGECDNLGDLLDEMTLESLNTFDSELSDCPPGNDDASRYANNQVQLTPKIGVSPIPKGCFIIKYGGTDRMAASIKTSTKFSVFYQLSYDSGASWF